MTEHYVDLVDGEYVLKEFPDLEPAALTKRVDDIDNESCYVGEALPDADEGDPVWRIFKATFLIDSATKLWADGNGEFDKVWDDRASYDYS